MPGIRITDVSYDTDADLEDVEDTFRIALIDELRNAPLTGSSEVTRFPKISVADIPYQSHGSGSTTYTWHNLEKSEVVHETQSGIVIGEVNNPLAYITVDMYENPIPAGSRLTFDGFQSVFAFENASGYTNQSPQAYYESYETAADHVTLWCSNTKVGGSAVRCPYNQQDGFYSVPINARYLYIAFRLHRNFDSNFLTSKLVYYLAPMHMYWQVLDYATTTTNSTISQQTQQLTDTTGANTIGDEQISDVMDTYEGLGMVDTLSTFTGELTSAVTTQQADTTVPFPGLSLMGFTLPAANVDVWDYLPSIREETRWATTLIFCFFFIRYIFANINAIFHVDLPYEMTDAYPDGYTNWHMHLGGEDF